MKQETTAAQAARLHAGALVWDAHCDTLAMHVVTGRRRLDEAGKGGHVDLPRLQAAGVGVQVFSLYVGPEVPMPWNALRALEIVDVARRQLAAHPDELFWVRYREDLPAPPAAEVSPRRIGLVLALEGCEVLAGQLSMLRTFFALGVRAAGLTWNLANAVADGVGEARGAGLTAFGRGVVAEMNRLGMVIDVSHLAPAGFWEVLEQSRHPVMASHSNARALCDHPRNLTDEQIRALAQVGGVIGINFNPPFLRREGAATLADVVEHIAHMVAVGGPGCVGLGSDFDGIDATPHQLEDVSRLPALTEALLARGFSEDVVRKVLGENFLRLFRQVLPSASGEGSRQSHEGTEGARDQRE